MSQFVTWHLCQLLVFLTCLALVSSGVLTYPQCLADERLDSVCYECAKFFQTPSSLYHRVYRTCCEDAPHVRAYCFEIYPENAQAGGMWI